MSTSRLAPSVVLLLLPPVTVHTILVHRSAYSLGSPVPWVLALVAVSTVAWLSAGRADAESGWNPWRRLNGHEFFLLLFFFVLLLGFVTSFERATGDGREYFVQLQSIALDWNFDFANASERFGTQA
ncbi:MAG: hypothetical protein GKS06_12060 [Acidobacteria bacterium]|nr:hypothetical protein [Acidobacteriota bacterium]